MNIRLSEPVAANAPVVMSEFEMTLQHLPGGVLVVDAASGTILYQNEKATALLDDSPAGHDDYQSYVRCACRPDGSHWQAQDFPIARALAGEYVAPTEVVYQRATTPAKYVLINATPMLDRHGTVAKALVLFNDISAQRHAEHALHDVTQRLASALTGADMMTWSVDIASGQGTADAAWFAQLGYAPSHVRPSINAFLSLLHPCDRSRVLHHWNEHLQGHTARCEVSCRLRTAEHLWCWIVVRAEVTERSASGKALRAVGVLINIDRDRRTALALRDSEQHFRCAFEHAAIGMATLSPVGRWLSANPNVADILGYAVSELLDAGAIHQLLHPADVAQFDTALQSLLCNDARTVTLEQRWLHKDGRTLWIELTLSSVCDKHACVKYLVAVLKNKSDDMQAREHVDRVQAHLRMATRIAGLGFWEWDVEHGHVSLSDECKALSDASDDVRRSHVDSWYVRIHEDDRERVLAYRAAYIHAPTPEYALEYRVQHNGEYRWMCVRGMPILDQHGRLQKIVGTHLDITARKNAEESARQRAQHDALTGLPNRGLLYEFSEHLIASARRAATPLAVLFLDLDHFKAINDTHGHKVGDGILKEVALRLANLMRAEDMIGRLGGDEFVAILPKIGSADDAAVVATKALDSLRDPYYIDGLELRLSPSIGISLFPKDGDTLDLLIQRADAAMYRVKHGERNNFRFYIPEWNEDPHRHTSMEQRLRAGLERREFDVHYQPIIDTRNGRVTSVEALLRWRPEGGRLIDPAVFIPVAEACGLIVPLGEWILQQACLQHRDWVRQGLPPMTIGVNVSAAQFRRDEFQHSIGEALDATGVEPGFIELELAESTMMKNFDTTVDILRGLKHLGLKIAVDDLGTGYSNLNQLSRLPIDKLKVDRQFVRDLAQDRSSLAITDAIIAMAHALGIEVVAEGIESEDDLAMLQQHACHHAQGFHISRPMSGDQFVEWYNVHRLH